MPLAQTELHARTNCISSVLSDVATLRLPHQTKTCSNIYIYIYIYVQIVQNLHFRTKTPEIHTKNILLIKMTDFLEFLENMKNLESGIWNPTNGVFSYKNTYFSGGPKIWDPGLYIGPRDMHVYLGATQSSTLYSVLN